MTNDRYDAEKVDASILGQPITLPHSGLVAKSRFLKAAMTERMSSWDQHDISKRGVPSKELIEVYRQWGKGGYGIVLSGNIMVDPISIEAPGNPIITPETYSKAHADAFRELIAAAKADGSLYIAQLSHAGRQVAANVNPNPISASDVKLDDRMGLSFGKPRAMTHDDIHKVIDQFAFAAQKAYELGADGVQLHGAHGYLLAQFLASTTNRRTDEYGGSVEKRAKIIYDTFTEIRKRVPDPKFSLGIKLNSVEFQQGGIQPEDSREVCQKLESLGVEFIELSGGTYEEIAFSHKRESSKKREAFFLEFADIIRAGLSKDPAKTTIWVTGGFRTAKAMVDAVRSGSTDGIGLARPATAETDAPRAILERGAVSVRKTLLDENDFGITNCASGTQMWQVGHGFRPFDVSDKDEVAKFQQALGAFFAKMGEDAKKGVVSAGYMPLEGKPLTA